MDEHAEPLIAIEHYRYASALAESEIREIFGFIDRISNLAAFSDAELRAECLKREWAKASDFDTDIVEAICAIPDTHLMPILRLPERADLVHRAAQFHRQAKRKNPGRPVGVVETKPRKKGTK